MPPSPPPDRLPLPAWPVGDPERGENWREEALADLTSELRDFFKTAEERGEDVRQYPLTAQLGSALARAARQPEGLEQIRQLDREFEQALRRNVQRHGGKRRTLPRPRRTRGHTARRRGSRRVAGSATRAGPSEDPEPEPPPPGLRLWRHPHWGRCSPNPLRVLVVGEVAR